jgi:hypothetical protein
MRGDFLDAAIRPFNARMSGRLIPAIREVYADSDTVIVFFDAKGTARDGQPYRTPMRGSSTCAVTKSSRHRPSSTASRSTISGSVIPAP